MDVFRGVHKERKQELGVSRYSLKSDQVGLERAFSRLTPMPQAQEGIRVLREGYQFGGYYTVRPESSREVGINWLQENGFPEPDNVQVCKNHKDKMRKILNDFIVDPESPSGFVALIDDNADALLKAASEMVKEDPKLRDATEKVILVGFGVKSASLKSGEVHIATGIRTFSLSSWEEQNVSLLQDNFNTLFA